MTDAEIIREYREAKRPLKQIGILADENQCSRGKIVDILRAAGMELPGQFQKGNTSAAGTGVPSSVGAAVGSDENSTQGKAEDEEADYGPILPALKLAGFSEWVNAGAVEVIARMMKDSDIAGDQDSATWEFRERVRGVLALVHELRGGYGE